MIRLLFSVGDGGQTAKTFHSIDLSDEKAKLLLQSTAVVIGFENCGSVGVHGNEKFQEFMSHYLRANRPGGVSATWTDDGGIVMPKEISDKVVSSFQQLEPEIPCSDPSKAPLDERRSFTTKKHPGYFVIDDPMQVENPTPRSAAEWISETIRKRSESAASTEDPRIIQGQGLASQLWLLLRPSGAFVKSTTEEGGESYIACTSFEEAQKVAEQQKIYDIECVPHRVF